MVPIRLMQEGDRAIVAHVTGDLEHVRRMHELGVRDGVPIQIIQAGFPCIARINGRDLCFRPSDVLNIFVSPVAAAPVSP